MVLIGRAISDQCTPLFQYFPVIYSQYFHHAESSHLIRCADQLTVIYTVEIFAVEYQKA